MDVGTALGAQEILVRLQWIANLDCRCVAFCSKRSVSAIRQSQRDDEIIDAIDLTFDLFT